jgi:hypothetical protein
VRLVLLKKFRQTVTHIQTATNFLTCVLCTRVCFLFGMNMLWVQHKIRIHCDDDFIMTGLWLCLYQGTGRVGRLARQLFMSTVWIHQASVQKGSQRQFLHNDQSGQEDKIDDSTAGRFSLHEPLCGNKPHFFLLATVGSREYCDF